MRCWGCVRCAACLALLHSEGWGMGGRRMGVKDGCGREGGRALNGAKKQCQGVLLTSFSFAPSPSCSCKCRGRGPSQPSGGATAHSAPLPPRQQLLRLVAAAAGWLWCPLAPPLAAAASGGAATGTSLLRCCICGLPALLLLPCAAASWTKPALPAPAVQSAGLRLRARELSSAEAP